MYDYKIVTQVSRKEKAVAGVLRKAMVVFAVLFLLMGIVVSRGYMLTAFLMALLYFAFDIFGRKDYEYRLEESRFEVDVVWGKRYRREAHELDLRELEVVAPHWHESVGRYRIRGGTEKLRKYDYTSYDDAVPYYTMIIKEDGRKIKLLLDLSDEMLERLKKMYPEKVFMDKNGNSSINS